MTIRCLIVLFLTFSLLHVATASAVETEIVVQLRRLCTAVKINGEPLRSGKALARFYHERDDQPAWSAGFQLLPLADELIAALPAAAGEGLDPGAYHLADLTERSRRFRIAPTPRLAAELDLLLSDAFMTLASHYRNGRIAVASVDPNWHIPREKVDPARMLAQALTSGRIRDSLHALLPTDPAYLALRSAWKDLRLLAAVGGWPQLTLKSPLRPGATGAEVTALRQRLGVSGDLPAGERSGDSFDIGLEAAVQHFQSRHGLTSDGIAGPETLAALNLTAAQRARQLAVNLERWRWLPRSFGDRYLRVNLPAFRLELVEAGETVLTMRVIVGRKVRPSPVFVEKMTSLVLNPYWEVPHHLAVADILPKILKDRAYLQKDGFTVFANNRAIAPDAIAWGQLGAGNFPYHLRQNPGQKNALGQIKFILPNSFNVYLHDTPSRKLFAREQRSFSSGCIRIEKPYELAERLLQGSPLAPPAALQEALKTAVSQIVPLPSPVPVYLLYFTAWVDPDGTVNFRPDLYQRDRRLADALALSSR